MSRKIITYEEMLAQATKKAEENTVFNAEFFALKKRWDALYGTNEFFPKPIGVFWKHKKCPLCSKKLNYRYWNSEIFYFCTCDYLYGECIV